MDLVFQRFIASLNEWMTTGELPQEEFRIRGVGRRASNAITALALVGLALFVGLCVYIAFQQP